MSLMVYLGLRSYWVALLETLLLALFTAAWFLGLPFVAAEVFKSMPIGAWTVLGAAYLLIVTIWWAPGEAADNDVELAALLTVSILCLLIVGIWWRGAISGAIREFHAVLQTRGGTEALPS